MAVTPAAIHANNPAPVVEAVFRRIERERMADVPLLNPVLQVEAVGFRPWEGHWLGVLVTPWFMNVVLLPGTAGEWRSAAVGEEVYWNFPVGELRFLASSEAGLGEFHHSSLFSPMHRFAAQEEAIGAAQEALDTLLGEAKPEAPAPADARSLVQRDLERMKSAPDRGETLTKRDFLRRLFPYRSA